MRLKSEKFKTRFSYILAVLILCMMFFLSFFAAMGDSGTTDEIAHIPSGYSYLKYQDFRLNPEHPPLAKALAGSLLQFITIKDIRTDWSWDGINQWEAGWSLLYRSGNNTSLVLLLARLPMLLLALGLGVVLFLFSKKYWGKKVALIVLALYAFYPDVLGHSHLVTTDIAAAFGYVITIWAFDNLMKRKTKKALVIAGIVFGLAQLLKFSSFLLFIILLILVFYRAKIEQKEDQSYWIKFWQLFKMYFWTCVISVIFVWIVYIPFVWNTPSEVEYKVIEMNLTDNASSLWKRNFLHLFEHNPILRGMGHYILGIMLVFARVAGGNATYIMGELSDKSIAWFFPVAWLIKTPLTIIILFVWSLLTLVFLRNKHKEDSWLNWIILTPIVVYWAFTLKGSLNIGIRHLMPTVPFIILFIGKSIKRYVSGEKTTKQGILIYALILLMIIETISYFPQYISYFNILIPRNNRYKYLVDSSLDWGQDLLRLKEYINKNNIDSIKVDYFGGSVPPYYIPQSVEWHSSYGPTTGWLAVSATYFQSSKLYGPKESKWSYEWLEQHKPKIIIGGSILVYHITNEDLAKYPPKSNYPITVIEKPGTINIYK